DLTIPTDYVPGRPIRLQGLGKRIGPWRGDLYIRLLPK
ncbi:MAG: molecular chaperone DnaJ, partial [Desulfovibrionales bacterium]